MLSRLNFRKIVSFIPTFITLISWYPLNIHHEVAKNMLQFSFQMWTGRMQENIDYKKHGDAAFRAKDYETAIEFYTEVSYTPPVSV